MSSWNMLRTVKSASELVTSVSRLTRRFPAEEQYVMVPMLRDIALTILENTALGMARLEHGSRYIALANAIASLNELISRFTLIKAIADLSDEDLKDVKLKCDVLRHQLDVAVKNTEFVITEPPNRYE